MPERVGERLVSETTEHKIFLAAGKQFVSKITEHKGSFLHGQKVASLTEART